MVTCKNSCFIMSRSWWHMRLSAPQDDAPSRGCLLPWLPPFPRVFYGLSGELYLPGVGPVDVGGPDDLGEQRLRRNPLTPSRVQVEVLNRIGSK